MNLCETCQNKDICGINEELRETQLQIETSYPDARIETGMLKCADYKEKK